MPTESPMSSRPRTTRGINAIRSRPGPTSRQGDVDSLGGSFSGGDPAPESVLPAIVRHQLHDLFGQIEREFEALYVENLTLHSKLDLLHEQLEKGGVKVDTSEATEAATYAKLPLKKPSASQISQRLKLTYKTSTSKIVSSFKQASQTYVCVQQYRGHRDGVWEVTGSRTDPQVIGTAAADHTACLWWIDTGTCLLRYSGHNGSVNSIRFHPSQDLALTASGDQTAHIWRSTVSYNAEAQKSSSEDDMDAPDKEEDGDLTDDVTTVRQPMLELSGHTGPIIAADWLTGGNQVITASWDRSANIYDAEKGEIIQTLSGHDHELTNVCTHPTQRLVVTSSKDTTFRLWDFRDPAMKLNIFGGHTQTVTTAMFADSDKVVSGSDDRTVRVWDLKNMRSPLATIRTDAAVNRLSVSSAMNLIAIPHDNRHVRLYDLSGTRVGRLPRTNRQGHTRMVSATAFHNFVDTSSCNLFSSGFDRQVIGWKIHKERD